MAGLICFKGSAVAEANDRNYLPLRPSRLAGRVWRGRPPTGGGRVADARAHSVRRAERATGQRGNALATARRFTMAATGS